MRVGLSLLNNQGIEQLIVSAGSRETAEISPLVDMLAREVLPAIR